MSKNKVIIEELGEFEIVDDIFPEEDIRIYHLCCECFLGYCEFYNHQTKKWTTTIPKEFKTAIDRRLVKFNNKEKYELDYLNCRPEFIGDVVHDDEDYVILKAKFLQGVRYTEQEYYKLLKRISTVFGLMIENTRLCDNPEKYDCFMLFKKEQKAKLIGFARVTQSFEIKESKSRTISQEELNNILRICNMKGCLDIQPKRKYTIEIFGILPKFRGMKNGARLMETIIGYYNSQPTHYESQGLEFEFSKENEFFIDSPSEAIMPLVKKFNLTPIYFLG